MASEEPPAETSPDTLIPVQENLSFQGYLRKRKDTMKFNWAKYWFKLQNTTLYFYTNKDQPETSLRGQYYMFSVQSVRSLSDADGDFTFEIVMKNGKRKLLSAESAELRDVWVKILWKSMQLPGPGRYKSSCTWYDIPQLIKKFSFSSADKQVVVTDENNLKIGQPVVVTDENNLKIGPPVVVTDENSLKIGPPVVVTDENNLKIGQPVVVTDDLSEEPPGAVQTAGIDDGGPDAANVLPQFLCSAQPLYTGENSDQSSDDDIYDVPRPQAMNLTVYSERTAGEEEEEEQQCTAGEEEQQRTAGEKQQRTAGEEEQQQRTAGEEEQQQRTAVGEEQEQRTTGEEEEEQHHRTVGEEEEKEQQLTAGEEEQQLTAGEEEQQRTAGEEEQQRTAVSGLQLYYAPSSDAAHTDVSGVVLKASTEVPDISSPACVPESSAEESSPD